MKPNVVLGMRPLPVAQKIERARMIVLSMTGNPNFTTPTPTLASITTAINALETAHLAALSGGVDDTALMHAREEALELQLKLLGYYVEGIASVNPLTAEAVILSAGMGMKRRGGRMAREFEAKATDQPGEIRLATRFVQRATYIWQMCESAALDAWQGIGQATRSRMVKAGLVPGRVYYFRVAVVNKNGQGPWSDVISAMAH